MLSRSELDFVRDGCRDGCRIDGRDRTDFLPASSRTIVVAGSGAGAASSSQSSSSSSSSSQPLLILSNGSARLIDEGGCGGGGDGDGLHLLCSVKAEIVKPSEDEPDLGVVEFRVDRLNNNGSDGGSSSSSRNRRDRLEALVSTLLADHWVDRRALCVLPGQFAWRLGVDLFIVSCPAADTGSGNNDGALLGGLVDAASHVIRAALRDTVLPTVTVTANEPAAGENASTAAAAAAASSSDLLLVDGDAASGSFLPGTDLAPTVVTVTVLRCEDPVTGMPQFVPILDASPHEEACAYGQLHVAVSDGGGSNGGSTDAADNDDGDAASGGGEICALQTSGGGSLPLPLLPTLTSLALEAAASSSASQAYRVVRRGRSAGEENNNNKRHNNAYSTPADEEDPMLLQETFAIQ